MTKRVHIEIDWREVGDDENDSAEDVPWHSVSIIYNGTGIPADAVQQVADALKDAFRP